MKALSACLLGLILGFFSELAVAQKVPKFNECSALGKHNPLFGSYCTICASSNGKNENACENYWNFVKPGRAKNTARRQEPVNAEAELEGALWSPIPSEGTCSLVSYNNKHYRALSQTLQLNKFEGLARRSSLSFSAHQEWSHSGGRVIGDAYVGAQILPSEDILVYLSNRSSSDKFKHFALPIQFTLFANRDRKLLKKPARRGMGTDEGFPTTTRLSHTNTKMGYKQRSVKEDSQRIVVSSECNVAYVLTKFQLCGRIQTFGRSWANSQCGGGLPESEVNEFRGFSLDDASDVEQYLQTLDLQVGQVVKKLGHRPIPQTGKRIPDGSVWRIMRVQ